MPAMKYETFLRRAFGLGKGNMIDRWGDPASLANTDNFTDSNINSVKAGVAYAIEIFNQEIINNVKIEDDKEFERIESFTGKIISATSIQDVSTLIKNYVDSVELKYFDAKDGVKKLK